MRRPATLAGHFARVRPAARSSLPKLSLPRRLRELLKTIAGRGLEVVTHCWNVARSSIFTARCQGLFSGDRLFLQNPLIPIIWLHPALRGCSQCACAYHGGVARNDWCRLGDSNTRPHHYELYFAVVSDDRIPLPQIGRACTNR